MDSLYAYFLNKILCNYINELIQGSDAMFSKKYILIKGLFQHTLLVTELR